MLKKIFISISIITSFLLIITWYSHILSTQLKDPLGLTVDLILYNSSIFFKIVLFIIIIIFYYQIIPSLYKNKKSVLYYFLCSFGYSLFFIILLAIFRNTIAELFNNPVTKYYFYEKSGVYPLKMGYHVDDWHLLWKYGIILLLEISITALIFIVNSALGYFHGNKKKIIPAVCIISNIALLIVYNLIFQLAVIDYDVFHGDIYTGVLLFDLISVFLPGELYSSISILFYLNVVFTGIALIYLQKKRVPNV